VLVLLLLLVGMTLLLIVFGYIYGVLADIYIVLALLL